MLEVYKASAGSGKTYQLTKDYIFMLFDKLLHSGNSTILPHRRVLAVTFTNKATDEMKSRIVSELYRLASHSESDYRAELSAHFNITPEATDRNAKLLLIHILHDYSGFAVSTIDKFFQQIIRSFAREVGVSGGFNIELDTDMMLKQAVDNVINALSEEKNRHLLDWMGRYIEERIDEGKNWTPRIDLLTLGKEIFKENYQQKAELITDILKDKKRLYDYKKTLYTVRNSFQQKLKEQANTIIRLLKNSGIRPEYFKNKMMFSTLEKIADGTYEAKDTFRSYAVAAENCYTKTQKQDIKSAIETLYQNGLGDQLKQILYLLDSEIGEYNTANAILENISLLGILADISDKIHAISQDQNLMLISNTNLFIRKIIDQSETPFVYERTGLRLHNYMIDEFQDTSQLQWNNFKPLITESLANGNVNMLVGDVKQSIYRWRNSEWKLLDGQVYADFNKEQIHTSTLDTNWRSDRNIVQFNNAFFNTAAQLLQQKLNSEMEENDAPAELVEELNKKITNAYSTRHQLVANKAAEGYVNVQFVTDSKSTAKWKEQVLQDLPKLLENLVERGYRPADIAFLVRKNDHAITITNYLLNYKNHPEARPDFSYKVIGKEGLKLNVSRAVRFIVALMKMAHQPTEKLNRLQMNYEYLRYYRKLPNNEALHIASQYSDEEMLASSLFTDEQNSNIEMLHHVSLYEAVEQIIAAFGLGNNPDETIFVQAFQDVVFKFQSSHSADLNSFIGWWNEKADKFIVSTPEAEDAFRIMTVHNAKGLDFKVVIVPFCDWDLSDNRTLLWCEPSVAPYNQLPLLPIGFNEKLNKSIFRKEYFDEKMQQYMDAINIAYVAFTRARNEMYCFVPLPSDNPKTKKNKFSNILIDSVLLSTNNDPTTALSSYYNTDNHCLEIGTPTRFEYPETESAERSRKSKGYPSSSSNSRLQIKNVGTDIWLKEQPIEESRINFGLVMHDILRKTKLKGDDKKVLDDLHRAGVVNADEKKVLQQELDKFWQQPEVEEWFSPNIDVLTETPILLPSGHTFRPDRVVLKENNATVIEYKFGLNEMPSHQRQLQMYINLIDRMGYRTNGYLYYVSLQKIIKV